MLIFLAAEIILLIILNQRYWQNFVFGKVSMLIFMILNVMMISIRVFIIDSNITPKHDPGITIYWCCCLKFGRRGKYSEDYRRKVIQFNIKKLKEKSMKEPEEPNTIYNENTLTLMKNPRHNLGDT